MVEVLRASSRSNPNAVAGALAGVLRASGTVEIQVVGAGALNQAIKAVAIARGYLAPAGMDVACRPTFAEVEIDGQRRTAIRLLVESQLTRSEQAGTSAEPAHPEAPAGPDPHPEPPAGPQRDPAPAGDPAPGAMLVTVGDTAPAAHT